MAVARTDWIDMVKQNPKKYLNRSLAYPNYEAIIKEFECSQSTARKLGIIAVKAHTETAISTGASISPEAPSKS